MAKTKSHSSKTPPGGVPPGQQPPPAELDTGLIAAPGIVLAINDVARAIDALPGATPPMPPPSLDLTALIEAINNHAQAIHRNTDALDKHAAAVDGNTAAINQQTTAINANTEALKALGTNPPWGKATNITMTPEIET